MERHLVFIDAGHTNVPGKDTGATGIGGVSEGNLTVGLKRLVIKYLRLLNGHVVDELDEDNTRQNVAIINALADIGDIAIDIHFNFFAKAIARGTEVLVPNNSSIFERLLATELSEGISVILNTVNRGVKPESMSAYGSTHSNLPFMRPNCENLLIEVCFITNQQDLDSYKIHKREVAKFIATTIRKSIIPEI